MSDMDRPVGLRVTEGQLVQIDQLADESGVSRSEMIRLLVEDALRRIRDGEESWAKLRAAVDRMKPLIDAARAIEAAYGQELGSIGPQLISISRRLPRLAEDNHVHPGTVVIAKSVWDENQKLLKELTAKAFRRTKRDSRNDSARTAAAG